MCVGSSNFLFTTGWRLMLMWCTEKCSRRRRAATIPDDTTGLIDLHLKPLRPLLPRGISVARLQQEVQETYSRELRGLEKLAMKASARMVRFGALMMASFVLLCVLNGFLTIREMIELGKTGSYLSS
jgi:hypothetical protein